MSDQMKKLKIDKPSTQNIQRVSNPATTSETSLDTQEGVVQRASNGMMPLNGEQVNQLHQTIGTQATIQLLRERQANYKPTPVMKAYVDPNPPWVQRVHDAQGKDGSGAQTDHRSEIQRSFDERLHAPATVQFDPANIGKIQRTTELSDNRTIEKTSAIDAHQSVIQRVGGTKTDETSKSTDPPWYWRWFQTKEQVRVRQFYDKHLPTLHGLGFRSKLALMNVTVYGRIESLVQEYNIKRERLSIIGFGSLRPAVSELMDILSRLYPQITYYLRSKTFQTSDGTRERSKGEAAANNEKEQLERARRIACVERLQTKLLHDLPKIEPMFGRVVYRREKNYTEDGKPGQPNYVRKDHEHLAPMTAAASFLSYVRTELSDENFAFQREASLVLTKTKQKWGTALYLYKTYIEKDEAPYEINIASTTRDEFGELMQSHENLPETARIPTSEDGKPDFFALLDGALGEINALMRDVFARYQINAMAQEGPKELSFNPLIDSYNRNGHLVFGNQDSHQKPFHVQPHQLKDFNPQIEDENTGKWTRSSG